MPDSPIRSNLVFLASNTTNLSKLLDLLVQNGILEVPEKEGIDSKCSNYDSCSAMYHLLIKKGDHRLQTIIDCLRKTGNSEPVRTLENRERSKHSKVWFNFKESAKYFNGRELQIQKLEDLWKQCSSSSTKRLQFVAITGTGGIGKTELAIKFAELFHKDGHCILVNASDTNSILRSLRGLCEELDISPSDVNNKEKSLGTLVEEVYKKLSNFKSLIILDSLDTYDMDIIKSFKEIANKQSCFELKPLIIMTSRNKHAERHLEFSVECLELNFLRTNAAEKYFKASLKIPENDKSCAETLRKLLGELNGHPLSLSHPACTILQNKRNSNLQNAILQYIEELKSSATSTKLNNGNEASFQENVYSRLQISLGKIRATPTIGSDAATILKIVSFLPTDNIPISMLKSILKMLQPTFNEEDDSIFHLLADKSLCTIRNEYLTIQHSLQSAIRHKLEQNKETGKILDAVASSFEKLIETKEISLNQIFFAQAFWFQLAQDGRSLQMHPKLADDIHYAYYMARRYNEAKEFCFSSAKKLQKMLGSRHKWALKMCYWQGVHLSSAVQLQGVYEAQIEEFGIPNGDSFHTARNIAGCYAKRKNLVKAYEWFEKAQQHLTSLEENDNGATHLQIDIVNVIVNLEKYDEAVYMLNDILALLERKNKLHEKAGQRAKILLGEVLYKQGKYDLALREFSSLLKINENEYGNDKEHSRLLTTKMWIAKVYNKLGSYNESLICSQDVYEKRKTSLGENHSQTKAAKTFMETVKISCTINTKYAVHVKPISVQK